MDATVQRLRRQVLSGDYSQADIYLANLLRYNLVEELEEFKTKAKPVWVSYFLTLSPNNVERVKLAAALGDEVARRLVKSRKRNDFPGFIDEETEAEDIRFFYRNRRILAEYEWRLLTVDMAQMTLHHFEIVHPFDKRPEQALIATRRFALGEISEHELNANARDCWAAHETSGDYGSPSRIAVEICCNAAQAFMPTPAGYAVTWGIIMMGLGLGEKEDTYRQLLINYLLGIY